MLDWRLEGRLSKRLKSGIFSGEDADHLLLWEPHYGDGRKIFLFGLGVLQDFKKENVRKICKKAVVVMQNAGVSEIVFLAPKLYAQNKLEEDFLKVVNKNFDSKVKTVLYQGQIDD